MKEKMTIMLTLVSLIGLIFHYHYKTNVLGYDNVEQIDNNDSDTSLDKTNLDNVESDMEIVFDNVVADKPIDDSQCNKVLSETDKMPFNNAFKYFYSCKDENDTFTWNNNKFR